MKLVLLLILLQTLIYNNNSALALVIHKHKLLKGQGWEVLKTCQIPQYYNQGMEVMPESQGNNKVVLAISSGWYHKSKIVMLNIDLETCKYTETFSKKLQSNQWAEGISRVENQIFMLTWKENQVLQYQINNNESGNTTLELVKTLEMPKNNKLEEGWGLAPYKCSDASNRNCEQFIATDGSSKIYFIDIKGWNTLKSLDVTQSDGSPLDKINALTTVPSKKAGDKIEEYVFANVDLSTKIYMINLLSGKVVKSWDFTDLQIQEHSTLKPQNEAEEIEYMGGNESLKKNSLVQLQQNERRQFLFNGITYMADDDTFLVSGKMWEHLFKIKLDYHQYVENSS